MDAELKWIKRIKRNGHEESANRLISLYYQEMFAFVYKQTLDTELSMDLTQEIFISVMKSIGRFDPKKASFRTWLYKIGANRLVDYYRSKHYQYRTLSDPIDDYDPADGEDIAISLEYKDELAAVNACMNELESQSQRILRMKLFADYSLQEIADSVGSPLSTVKSKYYTALRFIKKRMEERRDDERKTDDSRT